MPTMPTNLTRHYAQAIARCAELPIPQASLEVARLGFSDVVGVMLAGALEPAVQCLVAHVRAQGAHPVARLVGGGARAGAVQAALVNATAAHALDYDDFAFSNHPSAVLVPTVLAAADACGASGARMAAAYLLGYEVWADLFTREKDLYYDRGWHPTAVLGPVGAAAAAAAIMGLDAVRASHALALAASDSGGVFENFGTMAKPYHGGRTAAAGLNAAMLAAAGMQASPSALEGRHGLLRALSPQGRVDVDTPSAVGEVWRSATVRLNIKRYPVVGAAQRAIDGVRTMPVRPAPQRVQGIVAHISARHAAVMPCHLPQDTLQAKFSIEFAIACALVHGNVGLDQLTDAVVRDPQIQRLMALVRIQTTDAYEPGWRDAAPFDIVEFTLDNGEMVATPPVRRPAGHADAPLDTEALWQKFRGCTRHAGVDDPVARSLFGVLQRIDHLVSPSDIVLPL